MAELILTDAEKAAVSYMEWDDAAVGKICKRISLLIAETEHSDPKGREACTVTAAALMLLSTAIKVGAEGSIITLSDVTTPEPIGSWEITLKKVVG